MESLASRCDRLDRYIAEGRLIRDDWTRVEDGRALARLLAAFSPEVAQKETAEACPEEIIPFWLADFIVESDGYGTEAAWSARALRFANLLRRSDKLRNQDWARLERRVERILLDALRESVSVDEWGVRDTTRVVIGLLDRRSRGSRVSLAKWHAAANAAYQAAQEANKVVFQGAPQASVASVAAIAGWRAACAAWRRTRPKEEEDKHLWGLAPSLSDAVADRAMHDVLDAIESAIVAREQEAS